jgi:MarR family transcriptional regulator, organic hydroperoxide resistance regulator
MPKAFSSGDRDDFIQAEADVQAVFAETPIDLRAMSAVSNIFRAATAIRNHMESTALAQFDLGWSAFTTLFVLRVWGRMEPTRLASEVGITNASLTGVVKTLEAKGLVVRKPHAEDGRRVVVSLSPKGRALIDKATPALNQQEVTLTSALRNHERDELARLLRIVLRQVEALDTAD